MHLDFWLKNGSHPIQEVPIERVFQFTKLIGGSVLLVENQMEYDYMVGMQYLMGQEIYIVVEPDQEKIKYWERNFYNIFLTYDPYDRNRI